jgi:hypothetical protein
MDFHELNGTSVEAIHFKYSVFIFLIVQDKRLAFADIDLLIRYEDF